MILGRIRVCDNPSACYPCCTAHGFNTDAFQRNIYLIGYFHYSSVAASMNTHCPLLHRILCSFHRLIDFQALYGNFISRVRCFYPGGHLCTFHLVNHNIMSHGNSSPVSCHDTCRFTAGRSRDMNRGVRFAVNEFQVLCIGHDANRLYLFTSRIGRQSQCMPFHIHKHVLLRRTIIGSCHKLFRIRSYRIRYRRFCYTILSEHFRHFYRSVCRLIFCRRIQILPLSVRIFICDIFHPPTGRLGG